MVIGRKRAFIEKSLACAVCPLVLALFAAPALACDGRAGTKENAPILMAGQTFQGKSLQGPSVQGKSIQGKSIQGPPIPKGSLPSPPPGVVTKKAPATHKLGPENIQKKHIGTIKRDDVPTGDPAQGTLLKGEITAIEPNFPSAMPAPGMSAEEKQGMLKLGGKIKGKYENQVPPDMEGSLPIGGRHADEERLRRKRQEVEEASRDREMEEPKENLDENKETIRKIQKKLEDIQEQESQALKKLSSP